MYDLPLFLKFRVVNAYFSVCNKLLWNIISALHFKNNAYKCVHFIALFLFHLFSSHLSDLWLFLEWFVCLSYSVT